MKKNSMKLLALLMMLALVLGMLAGCGNGQTAADAGSASTPASAVEESEDTAAEPVQSLRKLMT